MLKILHITTVPQSLGFIKGLVSHLKTNGYEVEVLSSPGELLEQFSQTLHVCAHAVEMPRRITPMGDLRSLVKVWRVLRHTKPAIVHAHTPKGGLLGILGAWFAHVPIRIYHIHGLPLVTAKGYKRVLLRWSERISCLLANQVLCVSHSVREVTLRERLCPPSKIKVLLNGSIGGIDAVAFDPNQYNVTAQNEVRRQWSIPPDSPVLGFVGRIVRDKGIVELITAWNKLKAEFPDLHLLIVGPFESRDPVPSEVAQQLLTDTRIHLTGWMSEGLADFYSIMTVCVLPTYREGFPVTPLEAAAMEIPVVATRVPGCIDAVVDDQTGTLIPARDAQALADAIRAYLLDPVLRTKHGTAGRARVVRDFNPDSMWEATTQEYARLVTNSRAAKKHV